MPINIQMSAHQKIEVSGVEKLALPTVAEVVQAAKAVSYR